MGDDARQRQLELDLTREAAQRSPAGLGLAEDEARVLAALKLRRGRERAIVSRELAAEAGVDPRRLRTILRHLVLHHLVPVGSATGTPAGYYVIASDEERRWVRDSLFRRSLRTMERSRAYDRDGIADRYVGQFRLSLVEHGVDLDGEDEDGA